MKQTTINLATGEWPDAMPLALKQKIAGLILEKNFASYPSNNGLENLRQALSKHYSNHLQAPYQPNDFLITAGAKYALTLIFDVFVQPGDEIIITSPYWNAFEDLTLARKAAFSVLPTHSEQDYKIDTAQLEKLINPRTKLFVLVNPANPSGKIYSKDELAQIADVLAKYPQVIILSDEIYEHVNFSKVAHTCMASFSKIAHQVLLVSGFSKSFAMTGWRIGYIAGFEKLLKPCKEYQEKHIGGTNVFAQQVALEAWNFYQNEHNYHLLLEPLTRRKQIVSDLLSGIPHIAWREPEGTFYYFIDVRHYLNKSIKDTLTLSKFLAETYGVLLRPGEQCGTSGFFRVSFANSEAELKVGITRLKNGLIEG